MHSLQFKDLELLSELYWDHLFEPAWKKIGNIENSCHAALQFFLHYYAFERKGSSPDYKYIAVDTIQDIKDSLWENLSSKEQDIWNYFKALKVNAFNEMLNPFCPKKTKYKKGKAETSKESIIEFIEKCDNKNIIVWAKEQLLINEVEKAFNLLLKINGIGGKIASFFLRDVAVKYNINVSVGRHLLQPIDVWVRYYVNNIMGNNFDDKKIQEYICDQCKKQDGLNPEKINQGIWYLCVEIAHSSKYLLKKCYDDKNQFLRLIKENRDMHAIANKVASKWIDRTSDGH